MGQTFLNVIWGVKLGEKLFKSLLKDPADDCSDMIDFPDRFSDMDTGTGSYFLGFSVATGGYSEGNGEYEIPEDKPLMFSEIETKLKKQLAKCKTRFARFGRWLKEKHNIQLPDPGLMLGQVERA